MRNPWHRRGQRLRQCRGAGLRSDKPARHPRRRPDDVCPDEIERKVFALPRCLNKSSREGNFHRLNAGVQLVDPSEVPVDRPLSGATGPD